MGNGVSRDEAGPATATMTNSPAPSPSLRPLTLQRQAPSDAMGSSGAPGKWAPTHDDLLARKAALAGADKEESIDLDAMEHELEAIANEMMRSQPPLASAGADGPIQQQTERQQQRRLLHHQGQLPGAVNGGWDGDSQLHRSQNALSARSAQGGERQGLGAAEADARGGAELPSGSVRVREVVADSPGLGPDSPPALGALERLRGGLSEESFRGSVGGGVLGATATTMVRARHSADDSPMSALGDRTPPEEKAGAAAGRDGVASLWERSARGPVAADPDAVQAGDGGAGAYSVGDGGIEGGNLAATGGRGGGIALSSVQESQSTGAGAGSRGPATAAAGGAAAEAVGSPRPGGLRWQRGDLLGAGSFGKVFLGLNLTSGQMMAVKQIAIGTSQSANSAEMLAALETEISTLQGLRHPNIVQYLGVERDEAEGTLSIFLEYVAGGSIHALLEKFGAFNEKLTRRYARHVVAGVHYLHANQILHRDIKGANVLVDQAGVCKLADFGASRRIADVLGASSDLRSLKGTPYWMAPEVIKQTGHGPEADVWSLGCTVIEMATGRPPWSHFNSQISALFHIASSKAPPPLPDGLTDLGRDFLRACLQRSPKERPTASQLVQHPWLNAPDEDLQSDKPVQQLIRAPCAPGGSPRLVPIASSAALLRGATSPGQSRDGTPVVAGCSSKSAGTMQRSGGGLGGGVASGDHGGSPLAGANGGVEAGQAVLTCSRVPALHARQGAHPSSSVPTLYMPVGGTPQVGTDGGYASGRPRPAVVDGSLRGLPPPAETGTDAQPSPPAAPADAADEVTVATYVGRSAVRGAEQLLAAQSTYTRTWEMARSSAGGGSAAPAGVGAGSVSTGAGGFANVAVAGSGTVAGDQRYDSYAAGEPSLGSMGRSGSAERVNAENHVARNSQYAPCTASVVGCAALGAGACTGAGSAGSCTGAGAGNRLATGTALLSSLGGSALASSASKPELGVCNGSRGRHLPPLGEATAASAQHAEREAKKRVWERELEAELQRQRRERSSREHAKQAEFAELQRGFGASGGFGGTPAASPTAGSNNAMLASRAASLAVAAGRTTAGSPLVREQPFGVGSASSFSRRPSGGLPR